MQDNPKQTERGRITYNVRFKRIPKQPARLSQTSRQTSAVVRVCPGDVTRHAPAVWSWHSVAQSWELACHGCGGHDGMKCIGVFSSLDATGGVLYNRSDVRGAEHVNQTKMIILPFSRAISRTLDVLKCTYFSFFSKIKNDIYFKLMYT